MNFYANNSAPPFGESASHAQRVSASGLSWATFWQDIEQALRADGYKPSTVVVYRQVLRDLRRFLSEHYNILRPEGVTRDIVERYQIHLSDKHVSWSWMATVIAVLRTCFDRYGGMQVTARMQTPRRKWPLPEILGERELRRILDAVSNPRDRLLVTLLSGCGLRVSEACRIRWADFNRQAATLQINDPSGLRSRTVAVPAGIQPLFQGLAVVSRSSDPIIGGRRTGGTVKPLGTRQAERIVRAAGRRAGVLKIVTPGNLRHTYAVRRLMAGENIRVVQETLGHRSVKTTLRYQACMLPKVASPADPPPSHPTLERLAATIEGLKAAFARMQTSAKPCGP